jgi:hypothetical protein
MSKDILHQIYAVNAQKVNGLLDRLTTENSLNRINPQTGTAGFYMRHIAEAQIMLCKRLFRTEQGLPYGKPFTLGVTGDDGQLYDVEETKELMAVGNRVVKQVIDSTAEEDWGKIINTFWGDVSQLECFSRILNHNAHHCGQIELCFKKGM